MGVENEEGFKGDSRHISLELYQGLVLLSHEINAIILFVHALLGLRSPLPPTPNCTVCLRISPVSGSRVSHHTSAILPLSQAKVKPPTEWLRVKPQIKSPRLFIMKAFQTLQSLSSHVEKRHWPTTYPVNSSCTFSKRHRTYHQNAYPAISHSFWEAYRSIGAKWFLQNRSCGRMWISRILGI